MHVIFKQQSARRRELFSQISRDQRLKIITASERVGVQVAAGALPAIEFQTRSPAWATT